MYKLILFGAVTLTGIAPAAWADVPSALAAYDKKEYSKAFTEFKSMAELGDDQARQNLVAMYFNGQGVSKDKSMALAWAQLMVEDNPNYESGVNLYTRLQGKVSAQEKDEANNIFQQLKRQFGHEVLSQEWLPQLKEEHNSIYEIDVSEAIQPLKRTAPTYPTSQARAGHCGQVVLSYYINSDGSPEGIKVDSVKGGHQFGESAIVALKKWTFPKAAGYLEQITLRKLMMDFKLDHDCKNQADLQVNSLPVDSKSLTISETVMPQIAVLDLRKTPEQNWQLAQQGVAVAQISYAKFLEGADTKTMPKNKRDLVAKQATELYLRSAVAGNIDAQKILAARLEVGCGCSSDLRKSRNWYELASKAGDIDATISLARILAKSENPAEQERAIELMKQISNNEKSETLSLPVKKGLLQLISFYLDRNEAKLAEPLLDKLPLDEPATNDLRATLAIKNGRDEEALIYQQKIIEFFANRTGVPRVFNAKLSK